MNAWLDRARAESIVKVTQRLGLTIGRDGKSFGPCPSCDRIRRSSEQSEKSGRVDRRGACVVLRGGDGVARWHCYTNGTGGCGAKGDVIDLAALVLCGRRWLSGDKEVEREVRLFFAGASPQPCPGFRQPRQVPSAQDPEHPRLSPIEVAEFLYGVCVPVVDVPEVTEFLVTRGISPTAIADRQLAFALRRGAEVPDWAKSGGMAWWQTGHQLIVPMFGVGPDGTLVPIGVRARAVRSCGDRPKSLAPKQKCSRGLVFAVGPHWLRDTGVRQLVTMPEGEIDALTLFLTSADKRGAVLGSISGSACREVAALIPRGSTVVLASHADPGGDAIAHAWRCVLPPIDLKVRRIAFERFGCAKADPGTATDRVEVIRPVAGEQGQ